MATPSKAIHNLVFTAGLGHEGKPDWYVSRSQTDKDIYRAGHIAWRKYYGEYRLTVISHSFNFVELSAISKFIQNLEDDGA